MSLYLSYGYSDASNYKQVGSIRLTKKLTFRQAMTIASTLDEGYYFIPAQVGLPATPYSKNHGEDDHPWHNFYNLVAVVDESSDEYDFRTRMDKGLYEPYPQDVVTEEVLTPEELVYRFVTVGQDGWDGSTY